MGVIYNARAATQVIGCLLKNIDLLSDSQYTLTPHDFQTRLHKIVFSTIYNLYHEGHKEITPITIEDYLNNYVELHKHYQENRGVEFVLNATEVAELPNFGINYENVKKHTLLRDLQSSGNFDVSYFYIHTDGVQVDLVERQMAIERLNKTSRADIMKFYFNSLSTVQSAQYIKQSTKFANASEGGKALKEQLKQAPEFGFNLENGYINTIFRGARRTKFYIETSVSSGGKSRTMIANACKMAIPFYYDTIKNQWIVNGHCEPTLYVSTEMSLDEVQTFMWAYVSGVDEDVILNGNYKDNEERRVDTAIELIEHYSNLYVYLLPDPNVKELEVNIRRECIQHNISCLFYDYIHSSPSLLNEFMGIRIREDVALSLVGNALKNLANELNIFVWSATQSNYGEEEDSFADARMIRSSKSLADKTDGAMVKRIPTEKQLKTVAPLIEQYGQGLMPNRFNDIYKNRRGKYTYIRVW